MKIIGNIKKLSALSIAIAGVCGTIQSNAAVTDTVFFKSLPMVIVWGADNSAENSPSATPIVSDLVLLGGTAGTAGNDIITGNVFPFVTGTISAAPQAPGAAEGSLPAITGQVGTGGVLTDNAKSGVLNSADTMTAFGINATTAISFNAQSSAKSFYVASNAPFDIFANTGAVSTSGDFSALTASSINWAMSITPSGNDGLAFGASAQDPSTGGTGVVAIANLGALSTATKVFDGGRKTAASAGSIAAQSVKFNVVYSLNSGYDFSKGVGTISIPVTYTIYNP